MTDININQLSESINNKADRDLGNLVSPEGENHFTNPALTNSLYTTNRILEIPQDIELELNNGTLTLKSGSKVYIPNGFEQGGSTPKFDTYIFTNDIQHSNSHNNIDLLFVIPNKTSMFALPAQTNCFSGPTAPSGSYTYALWYDTTTNLIKNTSNGGTTWTPGYSLPVCIATGNSSSTFASIDQIFNGFGYIGSTAFILPGIKGEVPNGRDINGTCLNSIYTRTSLSTQTYTGSTTSFDILVNANFILASGTNLVTYDSEKNLNTNNYFKLGEAYWDNGKCTGFKLKSVDSVVNSNASNFSSAGRSYLSGLGMPSDAGYLVSNSFASNTDFTAPCNGYFSFRAGWKTAGSLMVFLANVKDSTLYKPWVGGSFYYTSTGSAQNVWLPVKKGNKVRAQYNSNTDIAYDSGSGLWFIPAEGEN